MEEKDTSRKREGPLNRREFLQRSVWGAAGLGLGLSGSLAAEEFGKRRFYRADELTEEERVRLRATKAQRLSQEGSPQLTNFPPSGEGGGESNPAGSASAKGTGGKKPKKK